MCQLLHETIAAVKRLVSCISNYSVAAILLVIKIPSVAGAVLQTPPSFID